MKINNEYHPAQEASTRTTHSMRVSTTANEKNEAINTQQVKLQTKENQETTLTFPVSLVSTFVDVDHMPGY